MDYYFDVWRKYAQFKGRTSRKQFWMFVLINIIIGILLGIIAGILKIKPEDAGQTDPLTGLYDLAILIPSLAVGFRRMQDTGRSGWWIFLPIVNLVFFCLPGDTAENKYGPVPVDKK